MMLRLTLLISLLALAACGADGPPFEPEAHGTITVSNHGVSSSTQLKASNGVVTLGLAL